MGTWHPRRLPLPAPLSLTSPPSTIGIWTSWRLLLLLLLRLLLLLLLLLSLRPRLRLRLLLPTPLCAGGGLNWTQTWQRTLRNERRGSWQGSWPKGPVMWAPVCSEV